MRDFFYNRSDVLVAILIILAAAVVIYLRVSIIMDYDPLGEKGLNLLPGPPANEDNSGSAPAVLPGDDQNQEGPDASTTDPPAQTQEDPPQATTTPDPEPEPEPPPPANTAPAGTVQITVNAGDAASTIADKLLSAGAISDKQAFLTDVIAQGADSKLKTGTFTIPEGSSHSDIIAILIK